MNIKRLALVTSLIVGLSAGANAAVSITDFGTSTFTVLDGSLTTVSQTASSMTLVGTDFATFVLGTFSPVDISAELGIEVTGSVATDPASAFTVEAYDSNGLLSTYSGGSWAVLGATGKTYLSLDIGGAADLTDIIALQINNAGSGNALDATLTGASAVPEATTSILALLGATLLLRRRR